MGLKWCSVWDDSYWVIGTGGCQLAWCTGSYVVCHLPVGPWCLGR